MDQERWCLLRFTAKTSLELLFSLPEIETAGTAPFVIIALMDFYQFRASHLHLFCTATSGDVLEDHAALVS